MMKRVEYQVDGLPGCSVKSNPEGWSVETDSESVGFFRSMEEAIDYARTNARPRCLDHAHLGRSAEIPCSWCDGEQVNS